VACDSGSDDAANISPIAAYAASVTTGKAPLLVSFNAANSSDSDGQIEDYSWDFGDDLTASNATIDHVFTNPGNYSVTLSVIDNDGAQATTTTSITVQANQIPVASFIADSTNGKAPLLVSFNATASADTDGQINSYSWDFKDGQTGSGDNLSHSFVNQGNYSVALTVTDDNGAETTTEEIITVVANQLPVTQFSADVLTGESPLTVNFNAAASVDNDGQITAYNWVFGDNQSASGISTSHIFTSAGNYTVTLTTVDDNGAVSTATTSINVTSNQPPTARFVAVTVGNASSLIVSFDASSSTDSDGQISNYSWNFGDGQSASGVTASHTYARAGNYSVSLTVTDNKNVAAVTSSIVSAGSNQPPTASFFSDVISGKAPLTVNFDASASSDSDGQINSYNWSFADNHSSNGITASHTFTEPGSYTVTLRVTDDGNVTRTTSTVITANLNQPPTASFITDVNSGALPLVVNFNASGSSDSDGQISSYSWDFGDGVSASGVTSNHTYLRPGDYDITLTVVDDNGASSRASNSVTATGTYTANLSGKVFSISGAAVDSDVNDSNATFISNNTPALAQLIPNPVNLGGYLNVANTGAAGPSFATGDRSDFYRISTTANQTIRIDIADQDTGDLDLYVYFDDGSIDLLNPDFLSMGANQTESIPLPQSGNYVIEVNVATGFTNYNLVVGSNVSSLSIMELKNRLVSTDNFVPGEIIVRFNDEVLMLSALQTPAVRAENMGLKARAGGRGRPMLMGLGAKENRNKSFNALGITATKKNKRGRQFRSVDPEKQLKMDTLQIIKALRKRNDVLYAEPNYIRQIKQVPVDDFYNLQWHYPLINLPAAWDITTGSSNIIVAVIDTGVLLNHPDLQGQFSADGGYDFIQSDSVSQDGESGIDANPDDPGDGGSVGGASSFHGTHVSGTIAAVTSFTSGGTGVAGIAPGVKIMPLRALGNGGGTDYDVNQSVLYAAGLANDSGIVPANKADIINLSLGGGGYSQSAQDVYTQARNAGVIVVAAAGNESTSTASYPAAYDGVISVSAVNINKRLASYSNFGSSVDVAAPGGDTGDVNGDGYVDGVLSTIGDDSGSTIEFQFAFSIGTSMAAPHMAGVVALMKSIYSDLTPADVDSLLVSGKIIEDLGESGRDDSFGHGLINARKAVDEATNLAQGTVVETPFVSVSPASLNFGTSGTSVSLSAVNGSTGSLSILSVTVDEAWLSIVTSSVDADSQLGSYQVTVDRSGLADGVFTANITIVSSVNTVTVPVIMQVVSQNLSPDVGYQYIILYDADTGGFIQQQDGNALNGEYDFQFNNVSFLDGQRLYIIAGTDMDNDGFICDNGEACGAYLSLDQLKAITATDAHTNLDFTSAIRSGLTNLSTIATSAGIAIQRQQNKNIQK
jgi:serine protease